MADMTKVIVLATAVFFFHESFTYAATLGAGTAHPGALCSAGTVHLAASTASGCEIR
jgi:hypothetical protein